ncbi:GNAT family N-acetyltransferase [Halobellus ruber]|uniref:GNAT family N-acetyltransferase n=1 Tax=Halobellus ruber TaxID=2761102 RepID=A0A7J9SLA5_9EURY|nr:GNAT family N-acetyltransferase [Halobellus ruber]MBB6646806.1 GNAT family N-acetyltransferase [Halobellus ruber]
MNRDRSYPETVAGPFETPPSTFEDREGREIELRPYDGGDDEFEALVEMYVAFDPADRAQGIPPGDEERIRSWLDGLIEKESLNVIAWDDDTVAGHATLVPDDDTYELAIFVLQAYQEAGIGTRLMRGLLGYGGANGVDRVWLSVERWNKPAIGLYEKLGFEISGSESFEMEMRARIATED